jgi:hypothetical protein
MDPASAVAGIISLAALTIQTTSKILTLCKGYLAAKEDIEKTIGSLQALQDLLEETHSLAKSEPFLRATTPLTRDR